MKSIFALLVAFVCIGLCARAFDGRIRLLVLCAAMGMVLYVTLG